MSLNIVGTTFVTLRLAEISGKTQLAVLSLAAASRQSLAVFVGAAGALLLVTGLGVLVGEGLARIVPKTILHKGRRTALHCHWGRDALLKRRINEDV
jgi:putative Ca2+/H+ antiporter (TMEM165/GDT1 family)